MYSHYKSRIYKSKPRIYTNMKKVCLLSLEEYKERYSLRDSDLAELLGVSRQNLHNLFKSTDYDRWFLTDEKNPMRLKKH
jgi:DNA-binding XRE family transcriptional regulator